jgi:hypothetical protein
LPIIFGIWFHPKHSQISIVEFIARSFSSWTRSKLIWPLWVSFWGTMALCLIFFYQWLPLPSNINRFSEQSWNRTSVCSAPLQIPELSIPEPHRIVAGLYFFK